MCSQAQRPLCPAPPTRTPSPQNRPVQGLVGSRSVEASHEHEEGLGLPLQLQQKGLCLSLPGPLWAERSLQIQEDFPSWTETLCQTLQWRVGALSRGFLCYRRGEVTGVGHC